MHDFLHRFHAGGIPTGGGSRTIRRSTSRARRWHPDFDSGGDPGPAVTLVAADAALDFVDMSAVVDRIHAAFFHRGR